MTGPIASPFPYEGPAEWQPSVVTALRRVVDPEMALTIVDVGLVYGVHIGADTARVRLTMTSAACPVADVIVDDVEQALDTVLPPEWQIRVEVCHDVEWTPARMSAEARRFMQW
jgi:metal-sulfur cluster biosynthetic enzyme